MLKISLLLMKFTNFPVDTGRKLNVYKTLRRRPGRLLNVLCAFNLRPVSTGFTGQMTREFLGLSMWNFQGIAFTWTQTYSKIFKSVKISTSMKYRFFYRWALESFVFVLSAYIWIFFEGVVSLWMLLTQENAYS